MKEGKSWGVSCKAGDMHTAGNRNDDYHYSNNLVSFGEGLIPRACSVFD